MATRRWLALALLLLAGLVAGTALAAPRIGVMTMQPGEIFFERFGHDSIVVLDRETGAAISYNFGSFDPGEPGFFGRFVRGQMEYMLVAQPLEVDLATYRYEGRGVSIQWLALTPEQATRLAAALEVEARPENARYRYDYFTDNCATRVRDAIDDALGGLLHNRIAGRSRGNTYRSEAVRLASPAGWMWVGFDIGIARAGDRQLSRWEEAFVPMRLADSLREVHLDDGSPLVVAEQELLPHLIAPEPVEAPRVLWPWLLAGLAIAAVLWWLARSRPRIAGALAGIAWLVCGVLGALLLFMWLGTEHHFAWANENLLLFSPLCLLLLPGAWQIAGGREPGRFFKMTLAVVAIGATTAFVLKWVLLSSQANQAWIALLLPLHLALWSGFSSRKPPSTPAPSRSSRRTGPSPTKSG